MYGLFDGLEVWVGVWCWMVCVVVSVMGIWCYLFVFVYEGMDIFMGI